MYALITTSQLSLPAFATYTVSVDLSSCYVPAFDPNACGAIGFVFPNVDTDADGIPDGMERMYGMNRFSADSDYDGIPDIQEFPIQNLQLPGRDPLIP